METIAQLPRRALRRAHTLAQLGDGAFYVTSAIFLARSGWSVTQIGLVLAGAWASGAVLGRFVGRLADGFGLGRVSVVTTLGCAAALSALALGDPAVLLPALVAYAIAQSAWGGLRAALVQAVTDEADRVQERARLQALGNAAVAVGALVGGLGLGLAGTVPLRVVLLLDAVAYLVASILLARRVRVRVEPVRHARERTTPVQWAATLAASAVYVYMPLLSVALPLMIGLATGVPAWVAAACFAANTVGVAALQHRAAAAVTTAASARHSVLVGGALMASSCVGFWLALRGALPTGAPTYAVLGLAVVVQVLGEVRFAAAVWDLGYRLAPRNSATWHGTYAAAIPVARSVGPALLAPMVLLAWGWVAPAALFVAGAAALAVIATGTRRRVLVGPAG